MRRRTGRRTGAATLLAILVVVLLAAAGGPGSATGLVVDPDRTAPTRAAADPGDGPPDYRFLSSPDFLNSDIADLSGAAAFRDGDPNSWNDSWARALDVIMDRFASEEPDDVLVAGDLVNGHWGFGPWFHHPGLPRDYDYGIFDSVRGERSAQEAVRVAARQYYGAWRARFEERGLPVHVAIGDHELGDDPWRSRGGKYVPFKHRNLGLFRSEFATHALRPEQYASHPKGPAARTAYATSLSPDVLLVTVNVFRRTERGVRIEPDPQQLRWLDGVLSRARRDEVRWVVVQGHTPVVGPVRRFASSDLTVEGGRGSAFWQVMKRNRVDLYLAGEVHDVTAIQRDGIVQITHGGLVASGVRGGRGSTSYLVGDVRGDRLDLRVERFVVTNGSDERLWQPSPHSRPRAVREFDPDTRTVGTMRMWSDGTVQSRGGMLAPYQPGS